MSDGLGNLLGDVIILGVASNMINGGNRHRSQTTKTTRTTGTGRRKKTTTTTTTRQGGTGLFGGPSPW
jgi:hypothetical protein